MNAKKTKTAFASAPARRPVPAPVLVIEYRRGGKVIGTYEVSDPRESICRHYNSFGGGIKASYVPAR